MSREHEPHTPNHDKDALSGTKEDDASRTTGTYWQEKGEGRFTLLIEGLERGIADTKDNSGIILSMPGAPPYRFVAAESEVIFTAVEQRLGVAPVREFHSKFGKSIVPWRLMAETYAEQARAMRSPAAEAEYRVRSAFDFLNEEVALGGLNTKANDARFALGKALSTLEQRDGHWSARSRGNVEEAHRLLHQAPEDPDQLFQPAARHFCDQALAALERHFDERPATPKADAIADAVARIKEREERERTTQPRESDRDR